MVRSFTVWEADRKAVLQVKWQVLKVEGAPRAIKMLLVEPHLANLHIIPPSQNLITRATNHPCFPHKVLHAEGQALPLVEPLIQGTGAFLFVQLLLSLLLFFGCWKRGLYWTPEARTVPMRIHGCEVRIPGLNHHLAPPAKHCFLRNRLLLLPCLFHIILLSLRFALVILWEEGAQRGQSGEKRHRGFFLAGGVGGCWGAVWIANVINSNIIVLELFLWRARKRNKERNKWEEHQKKKI